MNLINYKYFGIDIAKNKFDAYINGTVLTFENNTKGFQKFFAYIKKVKEAVPVVVFEPTGEYSKPIKSYCSRKNTCFIQVNPYKSKRFIEALNDNIKTDKKDAYGLTVYAESLKLVPNGKYFKELEELKELVSTRNFLTQEKIAHLNRREIKNQTTLKLMEKHVKLYEKQIAEINLLIENKIKSSQDLNKLAETIKYGIVSKGIGINLISTLIAYMPELGHASAAQIASLAGLAPKENESGTFRGEKRIRGGRKAVRNALYMTSVCLATNPFCKDENIANYYLRLKNKGKPTNLVLTAVSHKILIRINATVKKLYSKTNN